MITAGTYGKENFFNSPEKLTLLRDMLFKYTAQLEWELQAWAIMSNHYHFVAVSPDAPESLKLLVSKLHEYSAKKLNRLDATT